MNLKRIVGWILVVWLGLAASMSFRALPNHIGDLIHNFTLIKLAATLAFYLPSIALLAGIYWYSRKFLLTQKLLGEESKQLPRNKNGLLETLDQMDNLFDSNPQFKLIKDEVRTIYKTSSRSIIETSLGKGLTLKEVCLYSIQAVCEKQLASGHHHIYRGTLSPDGYQIRAIFNKSIDELVKSNFCTPEEANSKKNDLEVYIKEVG